MPCRLSVLWCCLALSLGVSEVRAQTASVPAADKVDNAKEAAIVELLSTKVTFENDGTSVHETEARIRVQSDAGVQQLGLLTFPYQGATQSVEFDFVRVRKPDGTIVPTPQDNVQDLDAGITREAPFYSDLREKHVAVRGLSPGDTLEYLVRWRTTKPLAPNQFWYDYDFEHDDTMLDERLQISVPRERPIKIKSSSIQPVITEQSGRRIYNWKTSNQKDPSKNNAVRNLDNAIGRASPSDVQLSSFQSWDEVGKWYWGLQQDRVQPSAQIRSKVAELTKGATDAEATLHLVYDFVSTKFRYIGVAFGIGRYQPHSADDVLSNQYGDCKDKYTLLASLLQAGGVTVYPALINSGRKLDPDVPSPAQFDHVIGAVPQGKNYLWLDTTAEVGPFGYLVSVLRDKQALVIPGDKPAMLVTTPADPPFANEQTFKVDAKLGDDGVLNAKMDYTARGDSEVQFRSAFRRVPQSAWKDLAQRISYSLDFSGTVSDVTASSPDSTADPFHFSYSYLRKDYPDWSTHRIDMPGYPFSMPAVSEDEAHSKDPIWLGASGKIVSDSRVELPKGYQPEMPASVSIERDYAEYHASYKRDHGVLTSHREMLVKLRMVPQGELADYKGFTKSVSDDFNRFIALTASGPGEISSPEHALEANLTGAFMNLPSSENLEAAQHEDEARAAMQRANVLDAVNSLKQALAADPKFVRGWMTLGALYMTSRQVQPALDAFQKAVDSNPAEPSSHKMLALALTLVNRPDEAIKAWQELLKVLPDDPDANSNIGTLLYKQKRYAEALPYLQSALKINPSNPGLLSDLGLLYVRSGEVDKGFKMIQDVLENDSSPTVLSHFAYELTDANVKLPDALEFAEKAVHSQEDASQKIQLSKVTLENLEDVPRIGSNWDTLGWVEFKLGRLDEAEKYLRASWQLSQRPTVADHLGQVYEKQEKRDAAIHTYRLALAASETPADGAVHEEIQQHLSRLLPGSSLSTGVDLHRGPSATEELSQMRTVKMKRLVPGAASAEFFLLFGPGAKLEAVQFISGSDKLKSAEKTIQAQSFPVSYPDGSAAHLIRRGILACSDLSGCEFVLYNPDDVKSVD